MKRGSCQPLHGVSFTSYVAGVPTLTVTSTDPILHVLAPVCLAAAAGTAVVIDCDPNSGWPFSVGSLSDLVADGPTARDLHPTTTGVALLGGPIADGAELDPLLEALQSTWPAVIIRAEATTSSAVRVEPALPWRPATDVTVGTGIGHAPAGGIPAPPIRLVRRVMRGHIDPRWRWIRHWRPVWELAR